MLFRDAFKLHVDDIEPVELARRILIQITSGDLVDFIECWLVFEFAVGSGYIDAACLQPLGSALSGNFEAAIWNRLLEFHPALSAGADQAAIETTAEAAVGSQHQQRCVANRLALLQQWMAHLEAAREQVLDQLRHA